MALQLWMVRRSVLAKNMGFLCLCVVVCFLEVPADAGKADNPASVESVVFVLLRSCCTCWQAEAAARGRDGPMKGAYQAFCAAARRDGHSFAEAAVLWKRSAIRRAIIEDMSVAERRKRKFTLDDEDGDDAER